MKDLRFGFRMAWKSPGFTLVAVLTLAIGIAASTTVFGWIDSVLLRPLPGVSNGEELVSFETMAADGSPVMNSYPDYRDYRDQLKLVSGLAMAHPGPLSIGEEDQSERVWGELVSGNYFAVLGVRPVAGRMFTPEEYGDKLGAYPLAVISERLWKRKFNSDPGLIGQTVRVNRQVLTVVGVADTGFRGTLPGVVFDIWIPVVMAPQLNVMPDWMLRDRKTRNLAGTARLMPGVSIEQARAEVQTAASRLAAMDPYTNGGISATLIPLWKGHFGAQGMLLGPLRMLMAVCGVVLLIVCANVANLLLARAMARRREFSVRIALGAGRARLVRQSLAESLSLAVLGSLAGIPMALWMGRAIEYLLPMTGLPVAIDFELNGHVLAFTTLLCVAVCVLSGIAPAWRASSATLNDVLKEGGREGAGGRGASQVQRLLVVAEVALAAVALIGAGLFARSFQMVRQMSPGFNPNNVLVSHLGLGSAGYGVPERKLFCQKLRARLETQPGVLNVNYADSIPLGFVGGSWEDLQIEGYSPALTENMKIERNLVAPGHFALLGVPLLEGRDFTEQDDVEAQQVMIVNETFARRFFTGREAVGRRVRGWGRWFTVIGVVKDHKYHQPNEAPLAYFYVPFRQVYRADLNIAFYLRTMGDPNLMVATLRNEVRALDPNVGVYDAMPLTESIGASMFPQKVAAALLAVLGAVGLLLAAVGLYSVMAYAIAQRRHEIGVRMALGARPADVLRMVVGQGMWLTAAGLTAGVLMAAAVTRVAANLLVNVSATDPVIFAGAALFLAAVALAASYLPARRATRIDPNTSLRYQ